MFKNLKEKLATQVTRTNQTLFSGVSSPDSTSISRDSGTRTPSITSRDDNLETHRSRLDSASSDVSQFSTGQSPHASMTYVSPPRTFVPPSDIESEYGGDESDHESNTKMFKMQKLLAVYKNKFSQLKSAYDEVEREKENIKNILQQHQDTSIKRLSDLRDQIKLDRQAKEQLECLHKKEIRYRENRIEELTIQLTAQKDLIQLPHETDHEEMHNLRDKNSKLEALLNRCKEAIKTHQEKQTELIQNRDDLLQQLTEKQTVIESMMKDRHPDETSTSSLEVKEHFDSDITVLLHDKERLLEQLESTRLCVQQLESEMDALKENKSSESDYRELLVKFNEQADRLDASNGELQQVLNNEKEVVAGLTDELNHLRETLRGVETLLPSDSSTDLVERLRHLTDDQQRLAEKIKQGENVLLQNGQLTNELRALKESASNEHDQHLQTIETLRRDYEHRMEALTMQLERTKTSVREQLDQATEQRLEYEQAFKHQHTDEEINQWKASVSKLEHDYEEASNRCVALTQALERQREEHSDAVSKQLAEQRSEFEMKFEALREEKNHLTQQIVELKASQASSLQLLKLEHERVMEELKQQWNTSLEDQIRSEQEKTKELNAQIDQHQLRSSQYAKEIEDLKSRLNQSDNELAMEFNSLKEQHQRTLGLLETKSTQLSQLQNEFDRKIQELQDAIAEKTSTIHRLEPQLAATLDEMSHVQEAFEQQQNDILQLTATIDDLKSAHASINDQYEHVKQELDGMKTKHSAVSTECDEMRQQLDEKQQHVDRLDTLIKKFKEANKASKTKNDQLENELVQANEKHHQTDQQIEEKQNQIVLLTSTIDQMQATNTTITGQLEQLQETIQTLKASLHEDQQLLEQRENEIESLKRKFSEQESLSHSVTQVQQEQQMHIERLNNEHQEKLNALKSELLADIHGKSEEIDALHQQLVSQRSQSDSHHDTVEHLRRELQQYESKFSTQTAQLEHLHDEQKNVSQSMTRLKNVLGVDAMDHDELIEQLVHKMEQSHAVTSDVERLSQDLAKQKSKETSLHQDLQTLEQQYDDNKDELHRLEQEFAGKKAEYENQISQSKQSIERLQETKQQLESRQEDLRTQLVQKTNQCEELQRNFDALSIEKDEHVSNYQSELGQQQTLNDNLRRESNDLHDEIKSQTNQISSLQSSMDKLQQALQSKIDEIEQLSQRIVSLQEDLAHKAELLIEQKQSQEAYQALEVNFNQILSEKAGLENQLDTTRIQMQTAEFSVNKKRQDTVHKLEQAEATIKELQIERDALHGDVETLRQRIDTMTSASEEHTRHVTSLESQQAVLEQEKSDKDRQLVEFEEKMQELQQTLKQSQESGTKLRKALHKMKETITSNEQNHVQESEVRFRILTEEYEEKVKEQEADYSAKMKAMSKDMHFHLEEKERQFNEQLHQLIDKSYQNENDLKEQIVDAQQQALTSCGPPIQNSECNHHAIIQELEDRIVDLQSHIETLSNQEKTRAQTSDHSSQTIVHEDLVLHHSRTNSTDSLHSFVFEPTEIDYLKQIILAYMTGTDRMTMAKVMCALLRYTDGEKSLILEHEKLRQTRWLSSSR